jgi:hypothetical protein
VADICQIGSYCAQKSTDLTACNAGYYCPDEMQTAHDATKKCRAGFYCTGGTTTMTPQNPIYTASPKDTKGNICAKGYYCPETSSKQFSCEPGTFMPYQMALAQTECRDCPYGKYCDTSATTDTMVTAQNCEAGYYCELKAINGRQNACDYDVKCVIGTTYPEKCAPEEYTPTSKASSCSTCADGKRCTGGSVTDCLAGTFCKDNTVSYCPPGKYGTATGKHTEALACISCEVGKACQQPNGRYDCAAGWFCSPGGAQTRLPNSSSDLGKVCEPGKYCVSGATSETTCDQGRYCANYAASAAVGLCFAGY